MRRAATRWTVAASVFVAAISALGQSAAPLAMPTSSTPAGVAGNQSKPSDAVAGGKLHGVVKSGNIPLPGVTVTAQNTLTGKRYSTTTDITGAWSMSIPQNGRYVVRTQFAAFAAGAQEALLNAATHDQTVNFALMLASRAAAQAQQEEGQSSQAEQALRQLAGNGCTEPEPGKRFGVGDRYAERRRGREWRSIAVNRRQFRLQRRFCGHQWARGCGKPTGRRGHGPAAGCDGDAARAERCERRARRELRQWWRTVWRWRFRRAGRFRRRPWRGRLWGRGWIRRWRRDAQLSRLQSRPATRRNLLDWQQFRSERRAIFSSRSAAGAA